MSLLGIVRKVCFILACLFAAIVVALASHIIVFTESTISNDFSDVIQPFYPPFAAMGLAAGALTLFTLPACLILDAVRKGAVMSMIFVEMIILTILWVLWLVTASLSASQGTSATAITTSTGQCSDLSFYPALETACNEAKAVEAMSFLAFITLLIYAFLLLVFALISSARGHSIWTKPVKGTNFFAPSVVPEAPPAPQMAAQYPPNFAPQPQMYVPGAVPQPIYPQFTGTPMMAPQLTGSPMMSPQLTGSPMMAPQPGLPMQAPQPGAPFQGPPPGAYQTPPPQAPGNFSQV